MILSKVVLNQPMLIHEQELNVAKKVLIELIYLVTDFCLSVRMLGKYKKKRREQKCANDFENSAFNRS